MKMTTEKGIDNETIAWVDGNPYSSPHFFCSLTTGGPGRGHLIIYEYKSVRLSVPTHSGNSHLHLCILDLHTSPSPI